jgi:hypothetical protein
MCPQNGTILMPKAIAFGPTMCYNTSNNTTW